MAVCILITALLAACTAGLSLAWPLAACPKSYCTLLPQDCCSPNPCLCLPPLNTLFSYQQSSQAPLISCFQNEKASRLQASQPCSCPRIIRLLSQEEGIFAQDLEPAPIEDGIVYPEPSDSPIMDTRQGLCSGQSLWAMQPSVLLSLSFFSEATRGLPATVFLVCSQEGLQWGYYPCLLSSFPLLAFLAVRSKYRLQPEEP